MALDWLGIKSPMEQRAERRAARVDPFFKVKSKGPYRPKWFYVGIMAIEGLTYGTGIYLLLQVVVWMFLLIPFSELPIYKPLDASPSLIHHLTNPLQDTALAFGAGFYEEVIFRYLLFWGLLRLAGKFKPFQSMKAREARVPHLPGVIPHYDFRDGAFLAAVSTGSVIYAFSHYVYYFGDLFSLYSFFYRFFFGLIMYFIFVRRNLSVAMLAHVVHDFWYFLFR
jgi:membrane protease YdiL (CAAX protease family)